MESATGDVEGQERPGSFFVSFGGDFSSVGRGRAGRVLRSLVMAVGRRNRLRRYFHEIRGKWGALSSRCGFDEEDSRAIAPKREATG